VTGQVQSRLTIGDFATLCHLSVRTLRKYHEAGLLLPDHVDPDTGYRYYTPGQLPTAQIIRRFRELDMPVREIATIVGTTDVDTRTALVTEHLHRLERRLVATHQAVEALQRLLAPVPVEATFRRVPERTVTAVVADVGHADVLDWYGPAMARIDAAVAAAGARTVGPPGGCYDNTLFTTGSGHVVVHVPTDRPVSGDDVGPLTLPAAELAVTVHHGEHHDIDVTYGALGRHLAEHALTVDGPVHETYLVGPRDTPDPAAWRTEIGWPIFRV
jgi:DNA-binding transcriptional MerR regulator/effector-binding domain-containing protein